MNDFRIGIDNYGLLPLKLEPLDILKWAISNGAEGVQFSGLEPALSEKIDTAYLKDMKQFALENDLYIEWGGAQHIPRDMNSWSKKDLFEINKNAAAEAAVLGTKIVRSCSGGLMRWNPDSPTTETLLDETAKSLRSQKKMLMDQGVILAIEIHFEFTTFELLRLFEMCETEPGEYLGICLDTMNLLTMLEHPVMGAERILPWIISTHIKDGALLLTQEGLVTFPTEIGKGIIDLTKIISLLESLPRKINLSIEDHGGEFLLPIFDDSFIFGFPDLKAQEFASLIHLEQTAASLAKQKKLSVTEREKWPEICESRINKDVQNLRKIIRKAAIK